MSGRCVSQAYFARALRHAADALLTLDGEAAVAQVEATKGAITTFIDLENQIFVGNDVMGTALDESSVLVRW